MLDPLDPPVKIRAEQLAKAWDGRVLVVYPKGVEPASAVRRALLAIASRPVLWGAVSLIAIASGFAFFTRRRRLVLALSGAAAVLCVGVGYSEYRTRLAPRDERASRGARGLPGSVDPNSAGSEPVRIQLPEWGTALLFDEGTGHGFGEVRVGDKLSHSFQIKNVGPRELPLTKLKMNCACNAQVEYDRDVIGPGEVGGIRVSMTAAGFGPQAKPIPFAVVRDGTVENRFTLNLNFRVAWLEQVQFVPSRLELGLLSCAGDQTQREIELVLIGSPQGVEPEVLEVESDSPAVRAEVVNRELVPVTARTARTIPAQRIQYSVRVTVDPRQLELGKFHGHVAVRTSSGEAKLHVTAEVCRPIVASPASLLVQKDRTSSMEHSIRLRGVADVPITIKSASVAVRGVACRIEHDLAQVVVRVSPDALLDKDSNVEIEAMAGTTLEMVRVPLVEF